MTDPTPQVPSGDAPGPHRLVFTAEDAQRFEAFYLGEFMPPRPTPPTPQVGDVVIFEAKDGHPETRCPIIREARSGPLNWRFFTLRNDRDKKCPTFLALAKGLEGKRFVRNGQEGVYA